MKGKQPSGFSRREKEMMDVIYRLGQATVADLVLVGPDGALVEGEGRTLEALPEKALMALTSAGALLYGAVGSAGIVLG